MSKKNLKIGIILIIIILIVTMIICIISKVNRNKIIQKEYIEKGYEVFGYDYCQGHGIEPAGLVFTRWTCALCGESFEHPDTAVPKLCDSCANKTGRCVKCGKLENK